MKINIKISVLFLLATLALTTGLSCKSTPGSFPSTSLEYWGIIENAVDIRKLTTEYTLRHPTVNITYKQFSEEEYKGKIIEGWALGGGPDLFMIPASKLREYLKFLKPMPPSMTVPVQFESGTLKKETITENRIYKGYDVREMRNIFLDVVGDTVVIDNKIYGLPYSVDTLIVYYNRELLKQNNIALPASNWEELIDQAQILSKVDTNDKIVQSAIALGTTNNIPLVTDIISNLMMQVGVEMGNQAGPTFQADTETLNAIQFYLSFAQPGRRSYSWNKDLGNALDLFTAGKLAYFIGYPYHAHEISSINPKLDWDVIPMLKPASADTAPTYADFWLTVVAEPPGGSSAIEQSKANIAWQYVMESSSQNYVQSFLNNPARPRTTALRSLVAQQKADLILGPFAQNLLTADNWYRGFDYDTAQKHFMNMIDNIKDAYDQGLAPNQLLQAGASLISQTYRAN